VSGNPYAAKAQRWAVLTLTSAGCIVCSAVVAMTLVAGSASGCFGRRCVAQHVWTAELHPTQYWFYVIFWTAAALIMGSLAIKAWRE
jgi:hypothetical protein